MMLTIQAFTALVRIWQNRQGQDLIEYALMAGFVAVAAGAVMPSVAPASALFLVRSAPSCRSPRRRASLIQPSSLPCGVPRVSWNSFSPNFPPRLPVPPGMGSLSSDLRHSLRVLAKSPGFTTVAVAALALGIGANTAIFSVINKVLLEPLPYPESDRIMRIARGFPTGHGNSISIPKFMAWKKNNQTFSGHRHVRLFRPRPEPRPGDHPEQVKAIHVSSEYFAVFGVAPVRRTRLPPARGPARRP